VTTASKPFVTGSATDALGRARDHLISRQTPEGWWKGDLRTNVTMDAEDLLMRQFLGILRTDELEPAARWIRSQQQADGTWSTFAGGPGDLSTTIEAYAALRLAGDQPDAPHLRSAREFVVANGGIGASRVFTRIWLALFGEWSWDDLPSMPPEVVLLPSWVPLNVYDWGCWARQTIVPITVVATLRPVRPLPFSLAELHVGRPSAPRAQGLVAKGFTWLDKALKVYDKSPVHPARTFAMRQAAEWIIARQEGDGGWGGIQPPWVYSILALHLMGYPLEHPVVAAAIKGLDGFLVHESSPDGELRWLEACQSPVWDTCLAMTALLDAGATADEPALAKSVDWMLSQEIRQRGDWSVKRPDLEPSGWAFEFANNVYPDIDDTAEVVLALDRLKDDLPIVKSAVDRGIAWVIGMQSKDGGWGAFDADNTRRLIEKLPFCDFGAVIDPPSADVTAHAVEMLANCTDEPDARALRRGVQWLLDAQEADGSWFGRWGTNYVYGTGAVVPALVAAGIAPDAAPIRDAITWLVEHQNADGGWGEDLRSYVDDAWRGRGESTASQTAWALLALLAAGETSAPSTIRGIEWLVASQRADGGWDEEPYTGTGFPGDFYISYEMYRLVFPISALGRYVTATELGTD
jgi:squalene-hopene/tetraprenyl-beta-curcumene cyclase